jgi:hypothetical protein
MKRIDSSWESLMKAAKLKNFRLHDCRHHFASKLVQPGVDLYTPAGKPPKPGPKLAGPELPVYTSTDHSRQNPSTINPQPSTMRA